jgi:hypothetical protein
VVAYVTVPKSSVDMDAYESLDAIATAAVDFPASGAPPMRITRGG